MRKTMNVSIKKKTHNLWRNLQTLYIDITNTVRLQLTTVWQIGLSVDLFLNVRLLSKSKLHEAKTIQICDLFIIFTQF